MAEGTSTLEKLTNFKEPTFNVVIGQSTIKFLPTLYSAKMVSFSAFVMSSDKLCDGKVAD